MTDKNYYGMTPNKGIHNNDCKNVKVQERTISTDLNNHIIISEMSNYAMILCPTADGH